jgi:hypothetical protein
VTKRRPLAVGLLAIAAFAGCDSSSDEAERTSPDEAARTSPSPPPSREQAALEERAVRGWVTAVARRDYDEAALYFAPGAIVDQGRPIRLPNAEAARAFNASLPCAADLVDFEDEPGPKALASFRLRAGPGGPCAGVVEVRFTIRNGRFRVWRQLPPEGQSPERDGPGQRVI